VIRMRVSGCEELPCRRRIAVSVAGERDPVHRLRYEPQRWRNASLKKAAKEPGAKRTP
jgi:hypothetical protein